MSDPTDIQDDLAGMIIVGVASVSPATGYAIAQVLGPPGMAFLETTDGGRSWTQIVTDVDATAHMRALVRASGRPNR